MRIASGLERLLVVESNVSDLIEFFASEDRKPLAGLLGVDFDAVRREAPMGSNRADLVFLKAGLPVAAIELKIGQAFSGEQRTAYENWATASAKPKLVLASLESAPVATSLGWTYCPLSTIFAVWKSSSDAAVSLLAKRVTEVLEAWSNLVDGVRKPLTDASAMRFADVGHAALLRVISRELSAAQRAAGFCAEALVSSDGGNPIALSWTQVPGVDGVSFIADARFESDRVHLRFGVDGEGGTAKDVWRVARALDTAITVRAFVEFLGASPDVDVRALALFDARGRGRPAPKGDWNAVIAAGKMVAGTDPGFLRDGLTRLECGARIAKSELNSWALEVLMKYVHDHLRAAWAASAAH